MQVETRTPHNRRLDNTARIASSFAGSGDDTGIDVDKGRGENTTVGKRTRDRNGKYQKSQASYKVQEGQRWCGLRLIRDGAAGGSAQGRMSVADTRASGGDRVIVL